jgi:hypothetical protein
MKKIAFSLLLAAQLSFAQNVGINPGGSTPDASSILDLNTGNNYASPNAKGLLIPNVALTSTAASAPVTAPATSLLVYNTATASSGSTAVYPGYYYWDGTKWVALGGGNGGKDWSLTGNAGTTASSAAIGAAVNNNFIGTTDNTAFVIATNNLERVRVSTAGYVGISQVSPGAKLSFNDLNDGTNGADGITWYSPAPTAYGIYRSAGAWSAPNYQQLYHSWQTGIVIDGGSLYGLSGTIMQPTAGNVAIGQSTKGAYNLEVNGTFGYGNGTAGSYRSRTEWMNDAGLIASQSGFFETASPTNYPSGASSWWHLISARHSNNGNNYAMQLSGSFFDQEIYVRKTNNNAAQSWYKMLTTNNVKVYSASASQTNINTTSYVDVTGLSVTITTSGTCAFVINTSGSLETQAPAGSNASGAMVAITQNGTTLTEQAIDILTNSNWSQVVSHWSINHVAVLAAGTYTFKVRARSYLSIFGTAYAFYAGGAITTSLPSDGSMSIVVIPQ